MPTPETTPDYGFTCLDTRHTTAVIHHPSEVHPSVRLGDGTVVWPYTTIGAGTVIGDNCTIGSTCLIGADCTIGDGTVLHQGACLPNGATVGQYVFIGAHVVLEDCKHPNLRDKGAEVHAPPVIEDDVVLGSAAKVQAGVHVGHGAVIGSNAVVTHDVLAGMTVVGMPARRLGGGHVRD